MTVLDAHCDAPSQMLRLRDFGRDNDFAQVDFPKMKRGGVDASFFAAYVPARLKGKDAEMYAKQLLDITLRQVNDNADAVAIARCAAGVGRNRRAGKTSILLGIENASAIADDLSLLKEYYKIGVRYITLVHSADNLLCDSCSGEGKWGGLSPFGKEVVREMNRLGMIIDLAHAADSTMRDVVDLSQAPVAYTHGCCRALSDHRRNISDDLMKGIAQTGGVVCMSIYPTFLDSSFAKTPEYLELDARMGVEDAFINDPGNMEKAAAWVEIQKEFISLKRPGVAKVVDHIEYAVAVAGIDHVGIGTDYDGIEVAADGLENISRFGAIWDEMRRRNFSRKDISKIAGENFLRVLKEVRKASKIIKKQG